jgi:uncharacterized lipoprotein YmbA
MRGPDATRRGFLTLGLMSAGLGMLGLAGCSSSSPAQIFSLAIQPGTELETGPTTLAVASAAIPKYLDRPQIVRHGGAYQLEVAEFDRWGEPFGDMVTRILVGDLAQRLPKAQVFKADSPTATAAAATLQIDFSRFDPDPDGTIVLVARWTLTATNGVTEDTNRLTVKPASDADADLVAAMSQALGLLADKIAATFAR